MVIAIIAILATLLLPALARAKQKAKLIQCVSNRHPMGLSHIMYLSDNNDTFSNRLQGWPDTPLVDLWVLLNLYISTNSRSFFRCPSDEGNGYNMECFASKLGTIPRAGKGTYVSANGGVHGNNGVSLLFVDGHAQFVHYKNLNPTEDGFYNFDWTVKYLASADLR